MTSYQAINSWSIYRDTLRITGTSADGYTTPMGSSDFLDVAENVEHHYGFMRVEEALSSLCKLRSQRETLTQILVHVYTNGLRLGSFHSAKFGPDHQFLLENTLEAIHRAIIERIKAVPIPKPLKEFEVA